MLCAGVPINATLANLALIIDGIPQRYPVNIAVCICDFLAASIPDATRRHLAIDWRLLP